MIVLGALESVDWVVSFEEDTPQRLIAGILPDLLVKGGDYKPEEIAGSEEVWANGGEVMVLNFEDGCSTTNIIKRSRPRARSKTATSGVTDAAGADFEGASDILFRRVSRG